MKKTTNAAKGKGVTRALIQSKRAGALPPKDMDDAPTDLSNDVAMTDPEESTAGKRKRALSNTK